MPSIFPSLPNGGIPARDANGNPIPLPANVVNAYVPPAEFGTTCQITFLPDDCYARVAPSQINAITSELLCLATYWNPEGLWNCGELCNLREAFEAWESRQTSGTIGGQLCTLPWSDGREANAGVIYCDGSGNAHKVRITGDDSLLEIFLEALCGADLGSANQGTDRLLYCGTGGLRSVGVFDYQLYRGQWAQAYYYNVNQMVERNGRLYTPNAGIPAGTPFVIGITGQTWREVSPTESQPYDPELAYVVDTIIYRNGAFYAANADIPANTPFVIGTAGQTWRLVDPAIIQINDFSASRTYLQNQVVAHDGLLYRAPAGGVPAGAWDVDDWELIGGEKNLYVGEWTSLRGYDGNELVLHNDRFYVPNSIIPPGSAFVIGTTGPTWREVSGPSIIGVPIMVEIAFNATAGWIAGEYISAYIATKQTRLPQDLLYSQGIIVNSTGGVDAIISMRVNGVEIGLITFNNSIPTFSLAGDTVLDPGDHLTFVAIETKAFDICTVSLQGVRIG